MAHNFNIKLTQEFQVQNFLKFSTTFSDEALFMNLHRTRIMKHERLNFYSVNLFLDVFTTVFSCSFSRKHFPNVQKRVTFFSPVIFDTLRNKFQKFPQKVRSSFGDFDSTSERKNNVAKLIKFWKIFAPHISSYIECLLLCGTLV